LPNLASLCVQNTITWLPLSMTCRDANHDLATHHLAVRAAFVAHDRTDRRPFAARRPASCGRHLGVLLDPCAMISSASGTAGANCGPDDVAATHVREQRADRRLRGRDRDVDRAALHQVDVAAAVDQRQRAARALPLCERRRQDVVLVVVGQRDDRSISSMPSFSSSFSSVESRAGRGPRQLVAITSARSLSSSSTLTLYSPSIERRAAGRCCRRRDQIRRIGRSSAEVRASPGGLYRRSRRTLRRPAGSSYRLRESAPRLRGRFAAIRTSTFGM